MTVNDLIAKISKRAGDLADLPIDSLRANYPEETDTQEELVRLCKKMRLSRGKIIENILSEEFLLEFDREMED